MTQTRSITTIEPRDQTTQTIAHDQSGSTGGILYRFISTLDADVHITLEGTDDLDGGNFAETETLPIGGDTADPDADTMLVSDGSVTTQADSTLLTERWPHLQFSVTAQTTPTTGSVELRAVKGF